MQQLKIGFIGAGNMARSLIGGLIANGYDPDKILAANPIEEIENLTKLQSEFNIQVTTDNREAAKHADVILFAVKPQIIKTVATEVGDIIIQKRSLVISIAAGVRTQQISRWLGENISIVRCMPNTPALVNCGATALFATDIVNKSQKDMAESIMRSVGSVCWVDQETDMDIVTALSGSGPAYFFYLIEILEKCATAFGLRHDIAHLLTMQTAMGAARMALESNKEMENLRHQVTSTGGTTEAALSVLQQGHLDKLFCQAIKAAIQRGQELGESLENE